MTQSREEESTTLLNIAARLFEVQQRIAAFDRLYNQEMTDISAEITQLKADFLQHQLRPAIAVGSAQANRPRRPSVESRAKGSARKRVERGERPVEKE